MLFIVALTVVLTTSSVYLASTPGSGTVSLPQVNLLDGYYHNGSNYTIVNYVFNPEGEPLSGYPFSVSLNGTNYTSTSSLDGFANISLEIPGLSGVKNINETNRIYTIPGTNQFNPAHITLNSSVRASANGMGPAYMLPVNNPENKYVVSILVFYLDPAGVASKGLSISYAQSNLTYLNFEYQESPPTSQNKTVLPSFNVYIFRPNIPVDRLKGNAIYSVTLRNGSGNILLSWYETIVIKPSNLSYPEMLSYLQYFIPLTSLLVGFSGYGRDVANGVMESVISKPTTKVRMLLSRYAATSISVIVSLVITVIAIFLLAYARLNTFYSVIPFMSSFQWLSIFWIFGLEALAFLSLIFLGSQLLNSEVWQVYLVVGIYIFFDLIFIFLNTANIQIPNVYNFLSPGGLLYLVMTYSSSHLVGNISVIVLPKNYLYYVFAGSLLYIIAPLGLAIAMARRW